MNLSNEAKALIAELVTFESKRMKNFLKKEKSDAERLGHIYTEKEIAWLAKKRERLALLEEIAELMKEEA